MFGGAIFAGTYFAGVDFVPAPVRRGGGASYPIKSLREKALARQRARWDEEDAELKLLRFLGLI